MSPSYTKRFSSSIRRGCTTGSFSWRVSEKRCNEAEEIASRNMDARITILVDQFSRRRRYIVNFNSYCTRFQRCCFWWGVKLVKYTTLFIISPRSLNDFWNFPRSAKSPMHGPHNYVDRTWGSYNIRVFRDFKDLCIGIGTVSMKARHGRQPQNQKRARYCSAVLLY